MSYTPYYSMQKLPNGKEKYTCSDGVNFTVDPYATTRSIFAMKIRKLKFGNFGDKVFKKFKRYYTSELVDIINPLEKELYLNILCGYIEIDISQSMRNLKQSNYQVVEHYIGSLQYMLQATEGIKKSDMYWDSYNKWFNEN